jgi:hypothetical protein
METKIKEIKRLAKENNAEIEVYQRNACGEYLLTIDELHTDNCQFIQFGIKPFDEDVFIKDFGLMTAEAYNKTINANCGEIQDKDVVVVLLKN